MYPYDDVPKKPKQPLNQCPTCRKFIKIKLIEGKSSIVCPHCNTWLNNEDGFLITG
jgi:uncharacterized paraquat-inducible protein A